MGGSKSKAVADIATDVMTTMITQDMMNCSTMVTQRQTLDVSGSGNVLDGVTMKQGFKINVKCIQDSNRKAQLDTAIATAVEQAAEAEGVALVGAIGASKSQVISNLRTRISTEITIQTLVNCASSINNTQGISIAGDYNLIRNVSLEQFGEMIRNCVQNVVSNTAMINDLRNTVDQQATAVTEGPLDFIADIFTGPTAIIMMVIVLIVIIAIAYLVMGGGGAEEDNEMYTTSTTATYIPHPNQYGQVPPSFGYIPSQQYGNPGQNELQQVYVQAPAPAPVQAPVQQESTPVQAPVQQESTPVQAPAQQESTPVLQSTEITT
tara:strand:- start:1321 stop:2286 length:966 start_codon:yes stop_codon:yes gene_type:complete